MFLICVFLIYSYSLNDNINNIRILTEEYPPLQYTNESNVLDGYATNVVLATMKELNISKKIELLDWDTAYQLILEKDNIALFSMMKNKEREDKFKWVGPIGTLRIALYKNSFDDIKVASLEQAKKYKISAVRDYGYTENLLAQGFKNIVECDSEKEAMNKLLAKEVDLYLTSNITLDEIMKKEGVSFDAIEKTFDVSISQFYIAFSKNYSDNLIKRWQEAIQNAKQESSLLFIDN
jgi:polar amino acid transport system substrate-binding protein